MTKPSFVKKVKSKKDPLQNPALANISGIQTSTFGVLEHYSETDHIHRELRLPKSKEDYIKAAKQGFDCVVEIFVEIDGSHSDELKAKKIRDAVATCLESEGVRVYRDENSESELAKLIRSPLTSSLEQEFQDYVDMSEASFVINHLYLRDYRDVPGFISSKIDDIEQDRKTGLLYMAIVAPVKNDLDTLDRLLNNIEEAAAKMREKEGKDGKGGRG